MERQGMIAYRNPDRSFRDLQAIKQQEMDDLDRWAEAASMLFLPAFEEFLISIEKEKEKT